MKSLITPEELVKRMRAGFVFDGPQGTMLGAAGDRDWETPEELNVRDPDRVRAMHRAYVEAGADMVTTNSFGTNRVRLGRAKLADKLREFTIRAAELAREVAGNGVLVAGDMGPTGEFLQPFGDHTYEEFVDVFAEQSAALAEGGADFLLIETMSDLGEIHAAIEGARMTGLGVVASMSFCTNYRTMMGVKPADAVRKLLEYGAQAVGANCGNGPDEMTVVLKEMREAVPDAVLVAQSNAGMPRIEDDRVVYDCPADEMAEYVQQWVEFGIQAVGACCGGTPEHIRAIRAIVSRHAGR